MPGRLILIRPRSRRNWTSTVLTDVAGAPDSVVNPITNCSHAPSWSVWRLAIRFASPSESNERSSPRSENSPPHGDVVVVVVDDVVDVVMVDDVEVSVEPLGNVVHPAIIQTAKSRRPRCRLRAVFP